MKVNLKRIRGPWDQGWVLDKHMLKSVYIGDSEAGHPQFDSTRTDVGEAAFQLKYRRQWRNARVLAQVIADSICPKLKRIGLIVPMPASNERARQLVTEVARALGRILDVPVFEKLLVKKRNHKSLKDLRTKEEKLAALKGTIVVKDEITTEGRWNVLLIDDLYDSGASMEVAAKALRGYRKIGKIYVAALTWK